MRTITSRSWRIWSAAFVLAVAAGCERPHGASTEVMITVRANACFGQSSSCYLIRVPLADVDLQGPGQYHFTGTTDETGEILVKLPRSGSYAIRIDSDLIAERMLSATVQVPGGQRVAVPLQGTVTLAAPDG